MPVPSAPGVVSSDMHVPPSQSASVSSFETHLPSSTTYPESNINGYTEAEVGQNGMLFPEINPAPNELEGHISWLTMMLNHEKENTALLERNNKELFVAYKDMQQVRENNNAILQREINTKEGIININNAEIAALRHDNKFLPARIQNLETEISALKQENHSSSKIIKNYDDFNQALSFERRSSEKENKILRELLAASEEMVKVQNTDLNIMQEFWQAKLQTAENNSQSRISELEKELQALEVQHKDQHAELVAARNENADLKTTAKTDAANISKQKNIIDARTRGNNLLKQRAEAAETSLRQVTAERNALKGSVQELEGNLKEILIKKEHDVSAREQEITKLQVNNQEIEAEKETGIAKLSAIITDLKEENQRLKASTGTGQSSGWLPW
jgi:hypothetical protein